MSDLYNAIYQGKLIAVASAGSQAKLGRKIGLSPAAIGKWDFVPEIYLSEVSASASVPAAVIRPDLFESGVQVPSRLGIPKRTGQVPRGAVAPERPFRAPRPDVERFRAGLNHEPARHAPSLEVELNARADRIARQIEQLRTELEQTQIALAAIRGSA